VEDFPTKPQKRRPACVVGGVGMVPADPWPRGKVTPGAPSLGCPLPWPWRGCGGPGSSRDTFFAGGLGAHFRVALHPSGEVGQEKGDGVTHHFWRQQRAVPRLCPWSESETGSLGMTIAFWSICRPRTQSFFFNDNVPYGGVCEIIWILARHYANVGPMRRIGFEKRTVWGIFTGQRGPPNLVGTGIAMFAERHNLG
jgi:hypothetical protein